MEDEMSWGEKIHTEGFQKAVKEKTKFSGKTRRIFLPIWR